MDIQQINRAIGAHGQWKLHLRQAIEQGRSEHCVDEVRRDDRCDFGNWLYALPDGQRGADWQRVRDLHAAFHREAAGVLALALDGRRSEAERAPGPGPGYAHVS